MKTVINAIGGTYEYHNISNFRVAKNELRWETNRGKNSFALPFIHTWTLDHQGDAVPTHHVHLDNDGGSHRWHCTCGDHSEPLPKASARLQGMNHALTHSGSYDEEHSEAA